MVRLSLRKEIRIRTRLRKIALKSNKAEDKKLNKSRNKINNMKKHVIDNYYNN